MIIETERLILRPWSEDDAEELFRYACDPQVGPVCGWNVHRSVEESRSVIRDILSADETYAIVLKETGLPVGSIGAFPSRAEGARSGELELGFWIGRPYWGRGLMPEAIRAIVRRCFGELNCPLLWCGYFEGNDKSRRTQEKCGFVFHHTEYDKLWKPTGEIKTEHFTVLPRDKAIL